MTESNKIKKNDIVISVSPWNDPADADKNFIISIRVMLVKSFGKKRGTGVDVTDENIKHFLYPESVGISLFKMGESINSGIEISKDTMIRNLKRIIEVDKDWIEKYENKAKPEIVEAARKTLEKRINKLNNPIFEIKRYEDLVKEIRVELNK